MRTATNTSTGERIYFDGQEWLPLKTATNPENNARIYLDYQSGQWKDFYPDTGTIAPVEPSLFQEYVTNPLQAGQARLRQGINATLGFDPVRQQALEREAQRFGPNMANEQALQNISEAGSFTEALGAIADRPQAVLPVVTQSLSQFAPALLLSGATGGAGPLATALTAGLGSGVVEFGASKAGDLNALEMGPGQFAPTSEQVADATEDAAKRAAIIGTANAVTGGLAGRLLQASRAAGGGVARGAGAATGEAGLQALGGAGGEAGAQFATEGRIKSPGEVLLEAAAEVPTAAVEIPGNYRDAQPDAFDGMFINDAERQLFEYFQQQEGMGPAQAYAEILKTREKVAQNSAPQSPAVPPEQLAPFSPRPMPVADTNGRVLVPVPGTGQFVEAIPYAPGAANPAQVTPPALPPQPRDPLAPRPLTDELAELLAPFRGSRGTIDYQPTPVLQGPTGNLTETEPGLPFQSVRAAPDTAALETASRAFSEPLPYSPTTLPQPTPRGNLPATPENAVPFEGRQPEAPSAADLEAIVRRNNESIPYERTPVPELGPNRLPFSPENSLDYTPPLGPPPTPITPDAPALFPETDAPAAATPTPAEPERAQSAPPTGTRTRQRVTTTSGRVIDTEFEVVDAAQLQAASEDLQPRDRTRVSSDAQIAEIGANLDPSRLADSAEADRGAPIVADDNIIESGNGRVRGIVRAYSQSLPGAAQYRQMLVDRGFPEAQNMAQPILIRRRKTPLLPDERRSFVIEANQDATMRMSATEQAAADSKSLDMSVLGAWQGGDVTDAANQNFVRAFINNVVNSSQRNQMVGPNGTLSLDGRRRIEAALLAKAYQDADLLSVMLESADNNVRSATNGMLDAAGNWSQLSESVASGQVDARFDISAQLVEAVRTLRDLREQKGNIQEFLAQNEMFGDRDPLVDSLLKSFFNPQLTRAVGREKVAAVLNGYVTEALKQTGQGLFGDAIEQVSPTDLVEQQRSMRDAEQETGNLFAGGADVVREGDGEYGPEVQGSGVADGGAKPAGDRAPGTQLELQFDNGVRVNERPDFRTEKGRAARRAAVGVLRKIRNYRGRGRIQGAFLDAMRDRETFTLVGETIEGLEDLALAAQIYRNPSFETFRAIVTDANGKVTYTSGISSRMPTSSAVFLPNESFDEAIIRFKQALNGAGPDAKLYVLHNHPSGDSSPSSADIRITTALNGRLDPGVFAGHVVIDTNEYSTIDALGNVNRFDLDVEQEYARPGTEADRPHPLLGFGIRAPSDLAQVATRVAAPEDHVVVIGTGNRAESGRGVITLIADLPISELNAKSLMGLRRDSSSAELFLVQLPKTAEAGRKAQKLYEDGDIVDAIAAGGDASNSLSSVLMRPRGTFEGKLNALVVEDRIPDEDYRPLRRTLANLTDEERTVFDQQLANREDGEAIRARLQELDGTAWAMQAIEGIFVRHAMEELMAGNQPGIQSMLDNKQVKTLRGMLEQQGQDGARRYLKTNGIVGSATKPVNNVNARFLDCEPSKACATHCYATDGHYKYAPSVVKAELIGWAIETDPVGTAKAAAAEYKNTLEFVNNKALRVFDKGDGGLGWTTFVKEMNKQGVRLQIFSKKPNFLRSIPDVNLRLLSIDSSNLEMADANLDLPVAFVYAGEQDDAALAKIAARNQIQVVFPIKQGQKKLTREAFAALKKKIKGIGPYLCPIDSGIKKLRKKVNKPQKGEWACTDCDKMGSLGCFYKTPSAPVIENLKNPPSQNEIERRMQEAQGAINEAFDKHRRGLAAGSGRGEGELSGLLSEIREVMAGLRAVTDGGPEARFFESDGSGFGAEGGNPLGDTEPLTGPERAARRRTARESEADDAGDGFRVEEDGGTYNAGQAQDRAVNGASQRAITGRLTELRYNLQDKFIDLKQIQDALSITDDEARVYDRIAIWEGQATAELDAFNKTYVEPLLDQIAQSGETLEDIGRFLVARHAREANAYLERINPDMENNRALSGMTNTVADQFLRRYRDNAAMQAIGRMVDNINDRRVEMLVNEGLLSEEEAQSWLDAYEHYVPLRRDMSEVDFMDELGFPRVKPGKGQGFSVRGRESQQRVGNPDLAPANIVANVLSQFETTIVRANKNRIGQAMVRLVQLAPDENFWQVDRIKTKKEIRNGIVRRVLERREYDTELSVKFGGETHFIAFNDKNPKAVRILKALKNIQQPIPPYFRWAMALSRYMSMINTTLSPEFVISNFARDLQTAGYNLSSTELSGLERRVVKDIPKAMRGMFAALRRGNTESEWARLYKQFEADGGRTGWIDAYREIEQVEQSIKAAAQRIAAGKPDKATWRRILDYIEDLNSVVENGVRLSAYKHALDVGMSRQQAAVLAKELTVNFNRKGMYGPILNALYLFYNASIQGSVRLIQAVTKSKRAQVMVASTVAFAFMLDLVNRSVSSDDDDGENAYDALPDWLKQHNLVIMTPGGKEPMIKIPLPYGYNLFHVVGQQFGAAITKDEFHPTDALHSVFQVFYSAFNPIGASPTLLQLVSPTALDPLAQLSENQNFMGNPVMPEVLPYDAAPPPASELYFSSVREPSKVVARELNDITGGNTERPGAISLSPEAIDLVIDHLTGSTGRFVTDGFELVRKFGFDRDNIEYPSDIPFLRRVTGYNNDYGLQTRYYQYAGEVARAEAEIKNPETREEGMSRPQSEMLATYRETRSALRKLYDRRKAAREAGRKDIEEQLDAKIRQVMAQFNSAYTKSVLGRDTGG